MCSLLDPEFIVIFIIYPPHPAHPVQHCPHHHPAAHHHEHDEKGAADQREGGLRRGKCN